MFNMIILDESSLKPLKTFGDRLAGARRVECWAQVLLSVRIVSKLLSTSIVSGKMLLSIRIVSMLLSTSMVSGQMLLSDRCSSRYAL